jgi:UDP:flavonoid glycosyltransferase YjiC (YdhE family)
MVIRGKKMGNIVITTHWLDGDVIPFIRIGEVLKRRGHQVTLLTHCYFKPMAEKLGLNFEPWDTEMQYEKLVRMMNGDINSLKGDREKLEEFRQEFESNEVRIKEYEKVIKYCTDQHTVILAKNRSSIAALLAAEKLNIPIASVFMNPTEVLSMRSYGQLYGKQDMIQLNELRRAVGISETEDWFNWQSSPKMNIALWPQWFADSSEYWPKTLIYAGFPVAEVSDRISGQIPKEINEMVHNNEKVILISGGTTKMLHKDFYPVSIEACRLLEKPTIVLTRYRELLPQRLPDNVKWYDYLPLDKIMPFLGGIIHHGGIGTLSGALKAALPQIILPYFVDRPFNASQAKSLGIAEYFPIHNWMPDAICEGIKRMLNADVKERCRVYADRMEENFGVSQAADWVEKLIDNPDYILKIDNPCKKPIELQEGSLNKSQEYAYSLKHKAKQLDLNKKALLMKRLQERGNKKDEKVI